MAYERVLVPTDGSDDAATTLEHARSIAAPDATVHALYVVDKTLLFAADDDGDTADALRAEGEEAVEALAAGAREAGLDAETELREGVPPREILSYIEERADGAEPIDAVVMGTRSRTGTERVVKLGSTTERVIENADVPVLAVPV